MHRICGQGLLHGAASMQTHEHGGDGAACFAVPSSCAQIFIFLSHVLLLLQVLADAERILRLRPCTDFELASEVDIESESLRGSLAPSPAASLEKEASLSFDVGKVGTVRWLGDGTGTSPLEFRVGRPAGVARQLEFARAPMQELSPQGARAVREGGGARPMEQVLRAEPLLVCANSLLF